MLGRNLYMETPPYCLGFAVTVATTKMVHLDDCGINMTLKKITSAFFSIFDNPKDSLFLSIQLNYSIKSILHLC